MFFVCIWGLVFPPTLFFAQHFAAAASVSCAPVLSLSLSPVFFFPFFPLLYCSTNSWSFSCGIEGAGAEEGFGSALVFFLLFFSPALNRFFSGVIERYVRVLSLSLSLSLSLCVLVVACHHLCLCYLLCYLLLALLDGCGINFTPPLC